MIIAEYLSLGGGGRELSSCSLTWNYLEIVREGKEPGTLKEKLLGALPALHVEDGTASLKLRRRRRRNRKRRKEEEPPSSGLHIVVEGTTSCFLSLASLRLHALATVNFYYENLLPNTSVC